MFHFMVFGVIGAAILVSVIALLREQKRAASPHAARTSSRAVSLAVSPEAKDPVRLDDFDPRNEALLVQLPECLTRDLQPTDFVTRPNAAGEGQELLFRNRVLVDLPEVGARRRIDLYVEALPG